MRIGFWNIARQNTHFLEDLIFVWASEQQLDTIILLESRIPVVNLLNSLNRGHHSNYFYSPSPLPLANSYFSVFTKLKDAFSRPLREDGRYQARNMIDPLYGEFSLILVHFQSKLHWQDDDQNAQSIELKHFIDDLEKQVGHTRTVLVGDFNMNPFQNGMIQTTGLHATMDRRIAEKGSRIVDGRNYHFFYNPMWSFFGEKGKGKVNGTYFYPGHGKPISYFWNIYDQVILRPAVLSAFEEDALQILTQIGSTNLITNDGTVDKKISDHLPVIFEFNLKNMRDAKFGEPLAANAGQY